MRTDETRSRAQIHLQLCARALLFDKACVSLFPRSNRSSPSSNSKLNLNCNSHHILLDKFFVIFVLINLFRGLMFLCSICSCTGMMNITLWRILHKMWHSHLSFLFEDDLINNGKERWLVICCEKSYKPF
ncbi:hypothetical protein Hdeb2414_s0008g00280691 [Helianthus debilis subsp. tardiflorus]